MIKVHFLLPDGTVHDCTGMDGESLMQLARREDLDVLEGACDGAMACATCHVIVDTDWYGKLPPPTESEPDMLDIASGVTRTSRLGCQVKLSPKLNGLRVRIANSN